jgi:membrane protease YdiL (CAAX protease family)
MQSEASDPSWHPGWGEVAVGLAVAAIIGFGLGSQIQRLGFGRVTYGLVLAGWSGFACLAGFAAAWRVRKRPLAAFGVRSTSRRWLVIGIAAGVAAFMVKGAAVLAFTALTGIHSNPQDVYAAGASGGAMSLLTATLLIGIVVPIGEELLFRGVVTTALLRHGPFTGVVGGALIFALLHGISIVFPAAVVAGLVAGEIYRRSGSVWPAVVVHVVYNLPMIPMMVLAGSV